MKTKKQQPKPENDRERSQNQAKAQLDSIREMVKGLDSEDDRIREEAIQTIEEDPLEVAVRSDWHTPGKDGEPGEYMILLCTGGPAVRVTGNLTEHNEPETARIEHQDWFTPWTEYRMSAEEEADVVKYASVFYFGE